MRIKKALIPVAGLGTRFLPATKAIPKEMLPIVDKPTLQYIVEEAVAAGIEHIVFVNGRQKSAIEDHFDRAYELEDTLAKRHKEELAEQIHAISNLCEISSIRQKEALGLGHAVLCGKSLIGDQPFAVLLGDDLMRTHPSKPSGIAQMMQAYDESQMGQVALMQVAPKDIEKYGAAVGKADPNNPRRYIIDKLVEKPPFGSVDTDQAVIGRYILPPSIWGLLEKTGKGRGGEIQLTDALEMLLNTEGLHGYTIDGIRVDAGDKVGYLEANLREALTRSPLKNDVRAMMQHLLSLDKETLY